MAGTGSSRPNGACAATPRTPVGMPRRASTLAPGVQAVRSRGALRWSWFLPAAAVSLVTMPLTAMWFLLLGVLTVVLSAGWAATERSGPRRQAGPAAAGSLGLGLLVGPVVYLGLALVVGIAS